MISDQISNLDGSERIYLTKNRYTYQRLRNDILTGRYRPNQRLVLKDLSADLDTSVMPIREALRQLEKDRLVVQIPHRGYTVAPLSLREMEELFTLRISLESLAVRLAAEGSGRVPALPDRLRELTDRMKEYLDARARAREERGRPDDGRMRFMAFNREFHLLIASSCGYTHLPVILKSLFDMSDRYMNLMEYVVGLDINDYLEHLEIARKIEEGSTADAVTTIERHITRVLRELRRYAERSGWIETGIRTGVKEEAKS